MANYFSVSALFFAKISSGPEISLIPFMVLVNISNIWITTGDLNQESPRSAQIPPAATHM
jgi:hypothetical protein